MVEAGVEVMGEAMKEVEGAEGREAGAAAEAEVMATQPLKPQPAAYGERLLIDQQAAPEQVYVTRYLIGFDQSGRSFNRSYI